MNYKKLGKLWNLFERQQKIASLHLLFIMSIGMTLEIFGVALILPAFGILLQDDLATSYPQINQLIVLMGEPSGSDLIIIGILFIVLIYVVKNFFLAFQFWKQASFSFQILREFSQKLLTVYLIQSYSFHTQRNSAILIRNITNEIELMAGSVITPLSILISELLVVLGVTAFLFYIQPFGLLITVSVILLSSLFYNFLTKGRIAKWGQLRQVHSGYRFQFMKEALTGIKDLKILGRESFYLDLFQTHNDGYTSIAKKHTTMQQIPRLWLEVLAIGGLSTLVIVLLSQGESNSQILAISAVFAVAAFRLLPSVNRIIGAIQSLRYGWPVIETLHKEFNLPDQFNFFVPTKKLIFEKKIEFRNVSYKYQGEDKKAIDDVSFDISLGESIGIIGPSGSGKTTLIDLILGLLKPIVGKIEIDDINLHNNLRGWQDNIGYVPQNIFLSDNSLRRNIAFGIKDKDINEDRLLKVIEDTQLGSVVDNLKEGLETSIGEAGVRLSGGQRQRIGIARALYHNPSVLVMDEATSALDSETELAVQEAINKLKGKKTIIIIAHRLSTVENCDRLLRLEDGIIHSMGPAKEILK